MVITFLDDILFPTFSIHFQRCGKHVLFKVATLAPYPNSVIIICKPAKEPINPPGFPAPFAPIHWNVHVVLKSKSAIWWICCIFAVNMFCLYYVIWTESLGVSGRAGANHNAQWHPEFLLRCWILFMYFCKYDTILYVSKLEIVL